MVKCFKGIILSGFALSLFFTVFLNNEVYAEFNISVSTSGAQNIDIVPKAGESKITSIATDDLTVSTTCRAGYNLTMSTSVNDNNLYLNGDSSNNASGTYFAPADGTTTLGNSTNTWGYLMSDSAPTTSSVFLAVPTLGNAVTLKNPAGTASQTDISDSFNIYYGVSASSGLTPGSYKMIKDGNNADGVITYYATMAESCNVYTITYNANSGNGSIEDQIVPKGDSVTLADNAFTRSDYYFKGWATSANGAVVYRPSQTVTPADDLNLYAVWGTSVDANLYNVVASLNRGTQTGTDLKAVITKGTSGVYTYNSSEFGTASDASNTSTIYYYRGILDTNLDGTGNTYGSDGNSYNYPNFVRLNDTCWRIFRTTGSGGIKLIYNGIYNGTAKACNNSGEDKVSAKLDGQAYAQKGNSTKSAWSKNINRVGYTYNNTSSIQDSTTSTSVDTVFGSNSNYSTTNTANSAVKDYLEGTWFDNAIGNYESLLEPNAGYCNDRSIYSDDTGTTALTSIAPYSTSGYAYFGPHVRNIEYGSTFTPTLTCPRGTVDIYSTSRASGGNKQLVKPVALVTSDEQAFAGGGEGGMRDEPSEYSSSGNYNYFMEADETFNTLSPSYRDGNGFTDQVLQSMSYTGGFSNGSVGTAWGVRPVISLASNAVIDHGSGTSTDPWTIVEPSLYDRVAGMSKGTQTSANLQASITASNSGVYEYNSSVFGADTDGTRSDNTKAIIYYYRGILDNTTGTYGSNGDGAAYPNYVILDIDGNKTTADTCWRIIRTTGSGGVKMIYNGTWTGSTCANATTNAQIKTPVTTSTFNGTASTQSIARQAVRVGYTHNSTYANTTSSSVAVDTLFGSNSNYSVNDANSTIKDNVESWFNSTISDYTSLLEPNAGYCNDRSAFQNTAGSTATTSLYSYTTSTSTGTAYRAYFGPYTRDVGTSKIPSLGCSRSTVDVYSSDTTKGGNGQLSVPVALVTADEASFAGSGSSTASQGSGYNANSYMRSGSNFWTMSPYYRSGSYAYNFYMTTNGYFTYGRIDTAYGIRPVISLKEGVTPSSGSGTATNPWVIKSSASMQNSRGVCDSLDIGETTTLTDSRDGEEYLIGKLADGRCWLLDNLRLNPVTVSLDALKGRTNASDTSLTYLKNGGGTTSDKYATAGVTEWTESNSYSAPLTVSTRKNEVAPVTYGNGSGKVGVYYNYCAASAGSYCYGNGTTASSPSVYYASEDICPSGWMLPTEDDYAHLRDIYDNNTASDSGSIQYNLSTPLNGFVNPILNGDGDRTYYWTSTNSGESSSEKTHMRDFTVYSTSTSNSGYYRRNGLSIRCIKKIESIDQLDYLQDFELLTPTEKSDIINAMSFDQLYTLKDKRDGTDYSVVRLADGNIWFADNLALDLTSVSLDTMNHNTNASWGTLYSLLNGDGEADDRYATGSVTDGATTSSWTVPQIQTAYKDTLTSYHMGRNNGKIGIYYNYCAVSAGGHCYPSDTSTTANATEDICPSGWRLPTGGSSGETQALYDAYGSLSNPSYYLAVNLAFNKTGTFLNGSPSSLNDLGYFPTSTANSNDTMYGMSYESGSVNTTNFLTRNYGVTVRCIMDK